MRGAGLVFALALFAAGAVDAGAVGAPGAEGRVGDQADRIELAQVQVPSAPTIGFNWQLPVYLPGTGSPPYVPPVFSGLIAATGDSYIGNGGGAAWSSGTYTTTVGTGASYIGDLLPITGNIAYFDDSWDYGVGAKSSLGVVDAIPFARTDIGNAAASSATISSGTPTTLTINTSTVSNWTPNTVLTGAGITGQGVAIASQTSGTAGGAGVYAITNPGAATITASAIGTTPNPAFATTACGNDALWSENSNAQYSLLTDPGNVVLLNNATNDNGCGLTVAQSIANVAAELDALGPNGTTINGSPVTGANKLVVMGDAHPRGVAISKDEVHAIAASVSPSFLPNTGVGTWTSTSGNCNGAIDAPVVAGNYSGGTVLNGTNTVFTQAGTAASQPASPGTYNLTSAGVYWFNASDVALGIKVGLSYCYISSYQQTGAALTAILDLHNWMTSSASDYVASCTDCSGTDYHTPGALYNRPWVTSVDTWGAMVDPASTPPTAHTYLNLPGASYEGLHNDTYGAFLNAQVEGAALQAVTGLSSPAYPYPTGNNFYVAKAGGTAATFTGTLPGVMVAQLAASHPASRFEVCYLLLCAVDNGSGTLGCSPCISEAATSGNLTSVSGMVNETTGLWSVMFSGGSGFPPNNGRIQAFLDPIVSSAGVEFTNPGGNMLVNGQMDYAYISTLPSGSLTTITAAGCNTANQGASNSNYVPQGWTLSGSAGDETALAAGTLVIKCGYGTAPDGDPGFFVSVEGLSGASSSLTLSQGVINPASFLTPSETTFTRAYVRQTYVRGPGGYLYGGHAPSAKVTNVVGTSGPVFGRPCPTANCTNLIGSTSSYAGSVSLSKLDLQQYGGTADSRDQVTAGAPLDNDVVSNTISSSTFTVAFSPSAVSEPVDYTVWFQNAAERITQK